MQDKITNKNIINYITNKKILSVFEDYLNKNISQFTEVYLKKNPPVLKLTFENLYDLRIQRKTKTYTYIQNLTSVAVQIFFILTFFLDTIKHNTLCTNLNITVNLTFRNKIHLCGYLYLRLFFTIISHTVTTNNDVEVFFLHNGWK